MADASFQQLDPWILSDFDNLILNPRGMRSEAIDPSKCLELPTMEQRKVCIETQLREHEAVCAAAGKPCVHGPVQLASFGYAGGRKLGLRTSADSARSFGAGTARMRCRGQCHRRACDACSHLNHPFYEPVPGSSKETKGTQQPATTTGDNFTAFIEPSALQRSACEMQCSNDNLGYCSYFATYDMSKAGNLVRFPSCYAPSDYTIAEQRMMDFELRYIETPDRMALVHSSAARNQLAVTETIFFSKPTRTGTAAAQPSTDSPGEPKCKLLFTVKHPTVPHISLSAYEHEGGACEVDAQLAMSHLSTVSSVGEAQTYAFGHKKGAVPKGEETAQTAELAYKQQLLRETAERLRKLPSRNLTEVEVRTLDLDLPLEPTFARGLPEGEVSHKKRL
jgi:hypothetical protein